MLEKFYPNEYMDSTYQISFELLYKEGIRGIIFDIDNTLVPHGAPADQRSIVLFQELEKLGFQVMLLSNNKEPRVRTFHDEVKAAYIFNAKKPKAENYKRAMELMKTDIKSTIVVGDQIFTDILGANNAGIRSILVKPIHPKEEIQIVFKRYLEKIVLFFYKQKKRKEA